jgi:hypothetical protein
LSELQQEKCGDPEREILNRSPADDFGPERLPSIQSGFNPESLALFGFPFRGGDFVEACQ